MVIGYHFPQERSMDTTAALLGPCASLLAGTVAPTYGHNTDSLMGLQAPAAALPQGDNL